MLIQYRRGAFATTVLSLVFLCANSTSTGQTVKTADDLIADYASYAEVDFLRVNTGKVKTKKLGAKGWHVAIEVPTAKTFTRVTLTADGWDFMRLLPLRGGRGRLARPGDSIEVVVPADGVGWFFLLNPFPEVSVREYRPNTLFKLANNTPRKAKYPVVDVHAHLRSVTAEERVKVMDAVGVAIVIDSPLGIPTELSYGRFQKKYPDRFLTFANVNFSERFEETFPANVIGKLRADVNSMDVAGISEVIDKGSGVYGHALMAEPRGKVHIDDDRMMAIWRAAARLKLPILLHVGEPIWFYEPIDENHEFLQWQSNSFRWNLSGTGVPSRDKMMERRAHVMDNVPELVVIGAHMGHLEDDLARLGELLDKYPNFHVEMGVRHVYLDLQPNTARRFHIKYQDRILFGQDGALTVQQYRRYFRFLETDDDQITIRSNEPKIYGLNLPDDVLRKIYYGNAARLMPNVKEKLIKRYPDLEFPEQSRS
ncbi:MAG TPA: amidohydrolase family protein [Pirellulaceae bacterium]|jgi:predicted TIM-barrel fold metal-dependent hydrolase|nr:amidohydrolase family protein [Pirellulaceae bacterium]